MNAEGKIDLNNSKINIDQKNINVGVNVNGQNNNTDKLNINVKGPEINKNNEIEMNKDKGIFHLSGLIPGIKKDNKIEKLDVNPPQTHEENQIKFMYKSPDVKINGPEIEGKIGGENKINGNGPDLNIVTPQKIDGNVKVNIDEPKINGVTPSVNINGAILDGKNDLKLNGQKADLPTSTNDFCLLGIIDGKVDKNKGNNKININGNVPSINENSQEVNICGNIPGIKGNKANGYYSNIGKIQGINVKGQNVNVPSGNVNVNIKGDTINMPNANINNK